MIGQQKRLLTSCIVLAMTTWAGNANSAGFALIEQSVSNMGTAYAGGSALANDTSTLYFNPAGMTRLEGTNGSVALHLVKPSSKFEDNGGSTFATALGGAPLGGGNGGDAGGWAAVPHTYVSQQISDRAWLGFAVNAPFGLTTEYDQNWVGRYHAVKSSVATYNFNPSFAFKASDQLSLSVGVSAQYLEAEFSNAIDFGAIDALPVTAGGLGGALSLGGPGAADGMVNIEGDSWGFGFNLGALFEASDKTRIGVHYRSEIQHDVKGDADFSGAAQGAVTTAIFAGSAGTVRMLDDTGVSADVTLPASASLSLFHQATPQLALMADYTWTGWSSIPELRFDFANNQPDGVTTFNWKDTNRFAVGAEYQRANSDWTYRVGVAFDESPIDSDAARTPRLPDADRIWLSFGAGVKLGESTRLDIGYAHLFMDDPVLNKNADSSAEDFLRGSLQGSYEASVDIVAVQLEMRFD